MICRYRAKRRQLKYRIAFVVQQKMKYKHSISINYLFLHVYLDDFLLKVSTSEIKRLGLNPEKKKHRTPRKKKMFPFHSLELSFQKHAPGSTVVLYSSVFT